MSAPLESSAIDVRFKESLCATQTRFAAKHTKLKRLVACDVSSKTRQTASDASLEAISLMSHSRQRSPSEVTMQVEAGACTSNARCVSGESRSHQVKELAIKLRFSNHFHLFLMFEFLSGAAFHNCRGSTVQHGAQH